jgi:hypothetical protein
VGRRGRSLSGFPEAALLESQDAQLNRSGEQERGGRGQKASCPMMYAESVQEALKERKKFEQAFRTGVRRRRPPKTGAAQSLS